MICVATALNYDVHASSCLMLSKSLDDLIQSLLVFGLDAYELFVPKNGKSDTNLLGITLRFKHPFAGLRLL